MANASWGLVEWKANGRGKSNSKCLSNPSLHEVWKSTAWSKLHCKAPGGVGYSFLFICILIYKPHPPLIILNPLPNLVFGVKMLASDTSRYLWKHRQELESSPTVVQEKQKRCSVSGWKEHPESNVHKRIQRKQNDPYKGGLELRVESHFLSDTPPEVPQSILWPSVWFLVSSNC